MAYQVIYKIRFRKKVVKLLEYLEKEWGQQVASDFLFKLDRGIDRRTKQPRTGIISRKLPTVWSVLITYQNRLFYRIRRNQIEIINMYDTRMDPKRNPYQ